MQISFTAKRVINGIVLALVLLSAANAMFGLNLFGRFHKDALIFSLLLAYIVVMYVGPSITEMRNYRAQKGKHRD